MNWEINVRSIQELFNYLIDNGYYRADNEQTSFMCNVLATFYRISIMEKPTILMALEEIRDYLAVTGCDSLVGALYKNSLHHSFEDCLNIYQDWENRPKLS